MRGNLIEVEVGDRKALYYTFLRESLVIQYGLPAELIVGVIDDPDILNEHLELSVMDYLKVNQTFRETLDGFCSNVLPRMETFAKQAQQQSDGWVYVIDQRTPDSSDQVPPKDILGGFEVRGGEIVSYKSNPNYLVKSDNGFVDFGSAVNPEFERYLEDLLRNRR